MYKNYLWATQRSKYNKKSQPYEGCLLCGVAKNDKGVIKKVVYQNDKVMVILNVFPYNVGHVQVVPIKHVETLEDLGDEERNYLFSMTTKTIALLKKTFNPAGINMGMNLGGDPSGASIAHIHVQIVPRYKRDCGFMETLADTRVMPKSLDDVLKDLKKNVSILKE
jgi:ATP adenylyltransferase